MKQAGNAIANRLSLRSPQRESLEILDRICDLLSLQKDQDAAQALATIRAEFANVTDFERDFPSLCFALATGVGKTRLMGAFIAYLHQAEGIRHFFVLAPNLTIYNKLISDFTPGSPKYVFQGLSDFVIQPPEIITGDNYESGRGVRAERLSQPAIPASKTRMRLSTSTSSTSARSTLRCGVAQSLVLSGCRSISARATSSICPSWTTSFS